MRRRDFLGVLGGATAAWPMAGRGQQGERMRRIAVFTGRTDDAELSARVGALAEALRKVGWVDGRNIRIGPSPGGETAAQWDSRAAELVAAAPDMLVAIRNPARTALKAQTNTIPIVFAPAGDPLGSGIVTSLARPGADITGFMHYEPAMGSKWTETLKDIPPGLARVLVLLLPDVKANVEFAHAAQEAGPILKVGVGAAGVRNSGDIERAVTAFA